MCVCVCVCVCVCMYVCMYVCYMWQVTCMFAVIGRNLFYERYPEQFHNFGFALFTMYQVATGDSWYFFFLDSWYFFFLDSWYFFFLVPSLI